MPVLPALALQKKLAYTFVQPALLTQALTHRSHSRPHNERLEFLGDSCLNNVVGIALYHTFPHAEEGDLSRYRAQLVREETLADIARELQLGEYLRLGSGEMKSGGWRRASTLADAVEALLGAVYLDGGFPAAQALVMHLYGSRISNVATAPQKDAKTLLQEWLQAHKKALAVYEMIDVSGAEHEQVFTVRATLPHNQQSEQGSGVTRKAAEQAAAAALLATLT